MQFLNSVKKLTSISLRHRCPRDISQDTLYRLDSFVNLLPKIFTLFGFPVF